MARFAGQLDIYSNHKTSSYNGNVLFAMPHAVRLISLHCAPLFAHYYFSFNAWPTLYDYSLQRQFVLLANAISTPRIQFSVDTHYCCAQCT